MAFFLVCGTHTFTNPVSGYEQVTARCQNCGNYSARVVSRWEWFTVCFVPLIPFSLKPWKEVNCHICNFSQDLAYRQDILNGQGQQQGQPQGAIPMQNFQHGAQQHQGGYPQMPGQAQQHGAMQYKPQQQYG